MATERHKKSPKKYINPLSCVFYTFLWINVFGFWGCAAEMKKPIRLCPGKKSAAEALALLGQQAESIVPMKAAGQCLFQYYDENKKLKKENFPLKLWANPPSEIYLQGDLAFDPKGIVLGSNEDEFWLAMKPKEISSYCWGRWSTGPCLDNMMIGPQILLEALGIVRVGPQENWLLLNEEGFDVLVNRQGTTESRRIYIDNCDYMVRRIEYFDAGQPAAVAELAEYKEVIKGFFVPSVIKIVNLSEDNNEDAVSISLSLKSIKPASFTDRQRKRLFTRPQPRGFKYIYKIVESDMIEQSQ
jgi:hypothetical protein